MKIDQKLINRVAELSRLELSQEEMEEYSRQLSDIINYVEKIKEMDTDSVEPTDHIVELKNVVREDRVRESLPLKDIAEMAPSFADNHFIVPRIIDGQE